MLLLERYPEGCRTYRVSQEEEEREGSRAVGMGTWRKAYPSCFLLQKWGVEALVWCFPVPPIPIVLKHSFLFLLARNTTWSIRWFELEGERGRGIKEGLRAVGMGTWRKAFFLVFLMPPIPIVLRCSFLFLLAHYADDKCVLSVDHFCLMFSLFGMPQSTYSFVW